MEKAIGVVSAEDLRKRAARKRELGKHIRDMAQTLSLESDQAKTISHAEALEAEAALGGCEGHHTPLRPSFLALDLS